MVRHYDLIVAGGGLTGVAAAVSAAREGLRVLLIEKGGCLGGAMSHALVYPFMKHAMFTPEGKLRLLSAGIFAEMCNRHKDMGGTAGGAWQNEIFKIMLDDMTREAGVSVLFHTLILGATVEGRRLTAVQAVGKGGVTEYTADFFVDATGDGDLMAYAGCEYRLGRESDGLCQPMTTCFRMGGVDLQKFHEEKPALLEQYKALQASGEIRNTRENILTFTGLGKDILHLNTTRVVRHNPVDPADLSAAEMEARRQVLEMYNFLRTHSEACRDAFIVSVASEIGVRESRKLKGVHVLTGEELRACVAFPDSIALGNYEIDIHNPEGSGTYLYYFKPEEYFSIPYRALLPKETDNLLVAGRCLSADHEAHSAVRIMPICATLGEAAGVAAAVARQTGTNAHTVDVSLIQAKLVEKGAEIR